MKMKANFRKVTVKLNNMLCTLHNIVVPDRLAAC